MISASRLAGFLIVAAFTIEMLAEGGKELEDFTTVTLAQLNLEPVVEKKDSRTGFLVGGKNSTESIQHLTELNGRPIAALERDMRPGQASTKGFLGSDESLLDVLAADNKDVIDERHLTHQDLARHLRILAAIGLKQPAREFMYHGSRFQVTLRHYRGYQDSPFQDGTKASSEAIVRNLTNGVSLEYSLLVPDMIEMIERYGFYEGDGTPYRVAPQQIVAVLDFLVREE